MHVLLVTLKQLKRMDYLNVQIPYVNYANFIFKKAIISIQQTIQNGSLKQIFHAEAKMLFII